MSQLSVHRRHLLVAIGTSVAVATLGMKSTLAQAPADVAARLQAEIDAVVASSRTPLPGAILYVSRAGQSPVAVASGVADIKTGARLAPDAKFRAGSIVKAFVATVVLQFVEEGKLALDDPLAKWLPATVTNRFQNSDRMTIRMLLNHTSGIPEWLGDPLRPIIVANPGKVWKVAEFLDIAAGRPPTFAPGQGWSYSNTNYNLLGMVVERATGMSWRDAVTDRLIEPLRLSDTSLPAPGSALNLAGFMHAYEAVAGMPLDVSAIDSSMADAAGGAALVSTVSELAAFLSALRSSSLFAKPGTFATMSTFLPAPDVGGQTGYGLGLQKYTLPGGVEMWGHLGGAPGYRSGTFYVPSLDLSLAFAMSVQGDPTALVVAALKVMGQPAR